MAAFEAISRVILKTIFNYGDLDIVDMRMVTLPRERPEITTFDPRNYRTPRNPIRPWMAYFNVLRNAVGTAVLGAPMAISQVGLPIGPLLAIATGLLVFHTHMMLLWCLNEISRQLHVSNVSYRYGFRLALLHGPPCMHFIGHLGPCIIALFMIMNQLVICASLVLYTADSLRDIADWDTASATLALFLPYFILEIFMRDLKIISQAVAAGCVLNVIGFILVWIHIFQKPGGSDIDWKPKGWVALLNAFGTTLFNLSAIGVVLSIEKALENPRIMTMKYGVLRLGILVPTCVSVIVGTYGYYAFGGMEDNILRSLPLDDSSAIVCISLYMVTVALTYPLQCYPCIQILTEVVKNHDPYVTPSSSFIQLLDRLARPLFVIFSFVIAYFVQVQGPMVAFAGSFCTTLLALVFPALMEIGLCYPEDYGNYNYILFKDILIVFLGLIAWISGMYFCGYLIYIRVLVIPKYQEFL